MRIARALFWTSGAATAWVLAGYPAALGLLPRRPWTPGEDLPRVSVVIAAYREREQLAEKLRALSDQDYPADRLQLIVVVDEDRTTAELAREARADASCSSPRSAAASPRRSTGASRRPMATWCS